MEQFLLEVDGRFIELAIDDQRGPDGAVLALTHDATRILPLRPLQPDSPQAPPSESGWPFPTMPQALMAALRRTGRDELPVTRIDIDVSALPQGVQSFSITEFVEQARRLASSKPAGPLYLTPQNASSWGWLRALETATPERDRA
jgi:hypothetical protein